MTGNQRLGKSRTCRSGIAVVVKLVPQPQAIDDIYPLSPMQQGMLFHTLLEHGGGDYINQMRLDVDGVDPSRVGRGDGHVVTFDIA